MFAVKAAYKTANGCLSLITRILFRQNYSSGTIRKLLVIRTGSIGDCIVSLPAIYSIRKHFPDANLDILTNEGKPGLVTMDQILDPALYGKCINYHGLPYHKLLQQVRREKYDLLIQLPQNKTVFSRELRLILFARLASVRHAFGFKINTVRWFITLQNEKLPPRSEIDRLAEIVRSAGIPYLKYQFPLKRNAGIEQQVQQELAALGLHDRKKNIAFVIGANRDNNKWPISYFASLADELVQKGYRILIVGGKSDVELAGSLQRPCVYSFCGRYPVQGSFEIFRNCILSVSNDTGPMHMSYSVGTPVVAIFSAWQMRNIWFPPPALGKALINFRVPCALCYREGCTNNICMQGIPPQQVLRATMEMLEGAAAK